MIKRFWLGVIIAVVISVLGIAIMVFVSDARLHGRSGPDGNPSVGVDPGTPPPGSSTPDDVTIKAVARDFLRTSAEPSAVSACLMVIDNGGLLNPCEDDLESRSDWRRLADLDPAVEVTGFDRDGERATITQHQLDRHSEVGFSLEIVHTRLGSWKVRELNGRAIRWEERPSPR